MTRVGRRARRRRAARGSSLAGAGAARRRRQSRAAHARAVRPAAGERRRHRTRADVEHRARRRRRSPQSPSTCERSRVVSSGRQAARTRDPRGRDAAERGAVASDGTSTCAHGVDRAARRRVPARTAIEGSASGARSAVPWRSAGCVAALERRLTWRQKRPAELPGDRHRAEGTARRKRVADSVPPVQLFAVACRWPGVDEERVVEALREAAAAFPELDERTLERGASADGALAFAAIAHPPERRRRALLRAHGRPGRHVRRAAAAGPRRRRAARALGRARARGRLQRAADRPRAPDARSRCSTCSGWRSSSARAAATASCSRTASRRSAC